eukprot:2873803-Prymnesium_polylepis.1
MNASLARATCENAYRAHTATCPLRMVASRVVCPRAVLQSKTKKELERGARARLLPPGGQSRLNQRRGGVALI